MKHYLLLFILLLAAAMPAEAAQSNNPLDDILPRPASSELLKGRLKMKGISMKCDPAMSDTSILAVRRLAADLSLATGKTCTVSTPMGLKASVESGTIKGMIFIVADSLATQEYLIDVSGKYAVVRASRTPGFLYAIQTIRQLLPESIYSRTLSDKDKWSIPCCTIRDSPAMEYRGLMLDSSSHFWSADEVIRCLDLMAMFKMNALHWHLTDNCGWRLESKSYPMLTQVGSWRLSNEAGAPRYGGHYGAEDVQRVISHASTLGISIIPEISIPSHFQAALAAYPELACSDGGPYDVSASRRESDGLLCAGKETTYAFLESVLGEVAELFPSEYVHLGFAESSLGNWKNCPDCRAATDSLGLDGGGYSPEQYLQTLLAGRAAQILGARGKKPVFWDGIPSDVLPSISDSLAMTCLNGAASIAENAGLFIDADRTALDLSAAYAGNPDKRTLDGAALRAAQQSLYFYTLPQGAVGSEACLWTDDITTGAGLEEVLTKLLPAIASGQWSEPDEKDFDNFTRSLDGHGRSLLEKAGYNW